MSSYFRTKSTGAYSFSTMPRTSSLPQNETPETLSEQSSSFFSKIKSFFSFSCHEAPEATRTASKD